MKTTWHAFSVAILLSLFLAMPVAAVAVIQKADNNAPTITGDAVAGATISYDFNDRGGHLFARHTCWEVYAFLPDGGILGGPILQQLFLDVGEEITLDEWPLTSWANCATYLVRLDRDGDMRGVPNTDLWYLVPPAP